MIKCKKSKETCFKEILTINLIYDYGGRILSEKLQRIKESMITKLDLPREMILDLPKVTIISNSEISIENHKGVIFFGENEIRIRTSMGIVNVLGANFEIIFVGGSTIALTGKFRSVVFGENE